MSITGIFNFFETVWNKIVQLVLSALPVSPVSEYLEYFESLPYLGYINWFIPIGTCVQITALWIGCIASYYILSAVLRWAKLIT